MFGKSVPSRIVSAVVSGAALLMTAPSASAFNPDLVNVGDYKKNECFIFGTLTVASFDVDVQLTVAFSELAAGVEANVSLVCSNPLGRSASAIVFLNTENDLIVPLELAFPGPDALFKDLFASRGHASKSSLHKFDTAGAGFVYRGTAGFDIETGINPFELEDRTNALLAQGTVVVMADGITGALDVRGALVQGTIAAP